MKSCAKVVGYFCQNKKEIVNHIDTQSTEIKKSFTQRHSDAEKTIKEEKRPEKN